MLFLCLLCLAGLLVVAGRGVRMLRVLRRDLDRTRGLVESMSLEVLSRARQGDSDRSQEDRYAAPVRPVR